MDDENYMRIALQQARLAYRLEEVPIGAVVVDPSGQVIGEGFNRREINKDPTAHAELQAIRAAAKVFGDWRLTGCSLYVTLEPCTMCAGAILESRVQHLYYGARNPKGGALGSVLDLFAMKGLNHYPNVTTGILGAECAMMLADFFRERRLYRSGREAL